MLAITYPEGSREGWGVGVGTQTDIFCLLCLLFKLLQLLLCSFFHLRELKRGGMDAPRQRWTGKDSSSRYTELGRQQFSFSFSFRVVVVLASHCSVQKTRNELCIDRLNDRFYTLIRWRRPNTNGRFRGFYERGRR